MNAENEPSNEPESEPSEPKSEPRNEPSFEDLIEQLHSLRLADFLLSTTMTIASLAYGKLESGELDEARLGIDALAALVPLLEGDMKRDLGQTLANLQLGYAGAVTASAPPG